MIKIIMMHCSINIMYTVNKLPKNTLLSPSMSELRTLSKVCEEYAIEFDGTFYGKQVSCCFSGVENLNLLI